jgi:hypothetical protein
VLVGEIVMGEHEKPPLLLISRLTNQRQIDTMKSIPFAYASFEVFVV